MIDMTKDLVVQWALSAASMALSVIIPYIGLKVSQFLALKLTQQKELATETKVIQALEDGVQHSYDEVVKALKAANEDGKLTKEEIYHVRNIAYEHALALLKGEARSLLFTWSKARVAAILSSIVESRKKAAR